MLRLRRWHKVLFGSALVLLVLAVAAYGALNLLADAAVRREMARIAERGDSVRFEDLAPRPVPAEDNAAPLYEEAFIATVADGTDTEEVLIAGIMDHGPWNEQKRQRLAERLYWKLRNASERDHLRAAMLGVRPQPLPDLAQFTEEVAWQVARNCLARNGHPLAIMRAADRLGRCRFDIAYDKRFFEHEAHYIPYGSGWLSARGYDDHLRPIRAASFLLSLEGRIAQHDGKLGTAHECVRLALRLERRTREPNIACFVNGTSIIDTALEGALQPMLTDDADHPGEWQRLLQVLEAIDRRPALVAALQGDRATGVWVFDRLLEDAGYFGERGRFRPPRVLAPLVPLALTFDKARYLRHTADLMDRARLPVHEWLEAARTVPPISETSEWVAVTRQLASGLWMLSTYYESECRIALARAALALKLYRHRHGRYPDDLTALTPAIVKDLPIDPFSGEPVRYRVVGDGYVVYSVGRDRQDNEANEIPPNAEDPDQGVDIVWRAER